jgi:Fe-Mn family superoxide dismutase
VVVLQPSFLEVMSPNGGGLLGELLAAIESFGSDEFKAKFSKTGATQFGSGWAWLCVEKGGKLDVCGTPNQRQSINGNWMWWNSILGMDVWEHAITCITKQKT